MTQHAKELKQTWQKIPHLRAIMLSQAVEHHSTCGHVHAHCKGLGGEEQLKLAQK